MSLRPTEAVPARTGTSLLYALLAQLRQYTDGVNLGRGDPDFATPSHILDAVRAALDAPERELGDASRLRANLCEAIAARLRRINGIQVDPQTEIVLTQGGQEALFLMVQTALAPGDEVLVPEPNYNTYADAIRFAGAVRVPVATSVEEHFAVDPEKVRAAITPATRAIVMVSPNNPSAAVLSPDQVKALAALAEQHDLLVLADDIYDRFLYDGAVHTSPASLPGMKARTLTLNALSKAYAMTGWRLGWVAGPAPLMAQLRRVKEATSGGVSTLSVRAGIAALTGPEEPLLEMHAAYTRRRRIVLDALDSAGFRYGIPQGGQFVLADMRRLGLSSLDLARRILEETHVLIYPGVSFGEAWDGFMRITFLQPEPVLQDALARVVHALSALG